MTVKHHYSGSFTSYILIYGFVYRNGHTNVKKLSKGVLVLCRAPSLRLGGGRGVTPTFDFLTKNLMAQIHSCFNPKVYISSVFLKASKGYMIQSNG